MTTPSLHRDHTVSTFPIASVIWSDDGDFFRLCRSSRLLGLEIHRHHLRLLQPLRVLLPLLLPVVQRRHDNLGVPGVGVVDRLGVMPERLLGETFRITALRSEQCAELRHRAAHANGYYAKFTRMPAEPKRVRKHPLASYREGFSTCPEPSRVSNYCGGGRRGGIEPGLVVGGG